MRAGRLLLVVAAFTGGLHWSSDAILRADDSVPIGSILAQPEDHHLTTVTIEGQVRQVLPVEPYPSLGRLCRALSFTLQDKSGAIQVLAPGTCGAPAEAWAPLSEGDHVVVEARIEAPGYYTGRGLPPGGQVRDTVRAIALKIQHIKD